MSWNRNTNERPWLVWVGNCFFLFSVGFAHGSMRSPVIVLGWARSVIWRVGFSMVRIINWSDIFVFSGLGWITALKWHIGEKNTCRVLYATLYTEYR